MRVMRVNITVPEDVVTRAWAAGLNVSRIASAAVADELDRLAKAEALDTYLAVLDAELGTPSAREPAEATE